MSAVESVLASGGSEEKGTGPQVRVLVGSVGGQEGFFCYLEGYIAELWQGRLSH